MMDNSQLYEMAIEASENSYSGYSGFRVGACLLTKSGKIYTGCNIENVSYSLTMCAERTAVFKAVSEGESEFKAIAVAGTAGDSYDKPCYPCGACLQVLSEFCGDDFRIILSDREYKLSELLPFRFTEDTMVESGGKDDD